MLMRRHTCLMDMTEAETLKSQTVTAHEQLGVTNINSETMKSSTCTSGRWLNVSNCFLANYLTHCSLAQSLCLSHARSQRQQRLPSNCPRRTRSCFSSKSLHTTHLLRRFFVFQRSLPFLLLSLICSVPSRQHFRFTIYCCFLSTE